MKKRTFLELLALGLTLPTTGVFAQSIGGGRPIRMIVPLTAGSSNDATTRTIAGPMSSLLKQNIVVENKAGGNGTIGTMDVVRAAPDGLTLLQASNSPLAVNMALVKSMPYDPRRDLTPIAATSTTNHVLLVRAESPIRSMAEFVDFARKNPGKLSIGYATSAVQVQIATISKMGNISLLPVSYKGTPPTITDVIGGVLDATLVDPGLAIAQTKGGRMRALGTTALKRNPVTPDWPAISETLPGFDFPSWNALVGPANLPREIVNRLASAVAQTLSQKEVIDAMASRATIPLSMGPDELKAYIESETTKWIQLAREANIQPS